MTTLADVDLAALQRACDMLAPATSPEALAQALAGVAGVPLRVALVDRGWYEPGGLVDGTGRRITNDLESWAMAECGGDLIALAQNYESAGYYVTRFAGRTIYLTATLGPAPLDFLQIEVDEVHEVLAGRLFDGDRIPDVIDDLVNPSDHRSDATALSPPRRQLRQARAFAGMRHQLTDEHKGDPRFRRFLAEWAASSAGRVGHFCDHWVLLLTPYLDSDGEHLLEARPLATAAVTYPDLARQRTDAVDYHPAISLQRIDAEAGYSMAWYFLQIADHYAPYRCMVDARAEFRAPPQGVRPLAAADAALLDNWVEDPYNFH